MVSSVTSFIPFFYPRVENDFDVYEPNNYPQSATRLLLGDMQCHTFHWSPLSPNEFSACDEDWFRVVLPAFGALEIKTFEVPGQPQPDTYLELFDSSMTLLASNDSLIPGSQFAWIPDINLAAGTYWVRASHRSPNGTAASRGHYHIQANFGPPVHTQEPNPAELFAGLYVDQSASQVLVNIKHSGKYALEVYDLQGKTINRTHFSAPAGTHCRFDLPSMSPGMYIATLRKGNSVAYKRFTIFER